MSARLLRASWLFVLIVVCSFARADSELLREMRTRILTPRPKSGKVDWARLQRGLDFRIAHKDSIGLVLGTSSLVATYACRDIEPVLMRTGDLTDDYNERMRITGEWIDEIMEKAPDEKQFLKKNYMRAYDLGGLHLGLSKSILPEDLGWKDGLRVPLNQQSVAFVLYSIAWQPIETMAATKEINLVKDADAISDWLYLWNVAGYAMGMDARLLPTGIEQAKAMAAELRELQYRKEGEQPPAGVRKLLKREMSYLYAVILKGKPATDDNKRMVRGLLAMQLALSPGLIDALGLGPDPVKSLADIDTAR